MAIGNNAEVGVRGYVATGWETTFGTYASSLVAIDALSCGFKTDIKSEKINSLSANRGKARRVLLEKEVAGTLEAYGHPHESIYLLVAGLGGQISTTVISSSEGVYSHEIVAGNFDGSITSLSFNVRKGSALTWHYLGGRVNSLKLASEVGSPLKISADFVFQDSTQLSDDISGNLTLTSALPFTFAQGTFSYSGSTEKITGFELTINNNLETGKDARALGQNTLAVLPAKRREVEFKITQRMDTTTTWQRFTSAENAAVQLKFTGDSISASYNYELTIDMPKVYYNSPDVEVSPDAVLISEIPFDVVVDNPYTSTGYDVKATIQNDVSSY